MTGSRKLPPHLGDVGGGEGVVLGQFLTVDEAWGSHQDALLVQGRVQVLEPQRSSKIEKPSYFAVLKILHRNVHTTFPLSLICFVILSIPYGSNYRARTFFRSLEFL